MKLRPELAAIVDALTTSSERSRTVHLDAIGEAIGARAVAADEIDAMIAVLESRGRTIVGPDGGHGEAHLKKVVATARALRAELGRNPSAQEIAATADLPVADVRHALSLVQIMQR